MKDFTSISTHAVTEDDITLEPFEREPGTVVLRIGRALVVYLPQSQVRKLIEQLNNLPGEE